MENKTIKKAASLKRKKTDKTAMINFGVIFCTVFSLIYIVGLLLVASFAGNGRAGLASLSSSAQSEVCRQAAPEGALNSASDAAFSTAESNPKANISISVDDGGYNQRMVVVSLKGSRVLEVNNRGVNSHSFVIQDLNIDSGPIYPGQTKKIVLEGIGSDIRNYDFYSNTGRDDSFNFGGVISVVE